MIYSVYLIDIAWSTLHYGLYGIHLVYKKIEFPKIDIVIWDEYLDIFPRVFLNIFLAVGLCSLGFGYYH
jgi:hypothetical protein